MRSYLMRLLRDDGCSVEADADAALRAIETGYDLVLSDVMLPGMDGLDLVRALRAAPATARFPILLLTARAGPESAAEGLRAGADDYIVKPFDPVELLARVRSGLASAPTTSIWSCRTDAHASTARQLATGRWTG
jgi:DNA-binding response OmpR family regulator